MKKRNLKKRVSAFLLAFLLPVLSLLGLWKPLEAEAAVGTTFIVHYGGREDGNYAGWNLWIWEDGFDGSAVDFIAEDNFGKIAMYQCTENTDKIGFIVRLNEWEAKDITEDRFATIDGSTVEIWVTSGVKEFATTPPEGCEPFDFSAAEEKRLGAYDTEGALKLNIHYYSYEENYNNVQCYAALGETPGGTYPLVGTDDFGAVFHVGFLDYEAENTAKVSMSINGTADTKAVRTVDISNAKDGVLDIYIVEGNPNVWYNAADADKTPIIISAAFEDTTKKIRFKTSKAVDTSEPEDEGTHYTVKDAEGNSYPIIKVWNASAGMVTDAYVIMDEPLDASKTYYLEREGYKGCTVAIAGAFSSESFEATYTYDGNDLGQTYTADKTTLRLWAPTATAVTVNLYEKGNGDCLTATHEMTADVQGTWVCTLEGDQNGVYYTYNVTVDGVTQEAVDPYARAVGVNGDRGMIVDLESTNPDGWNKDKHVTVKNNTDAIIYELHIRDTSIDESSGIENKGKYLGLTEKGTTTPSGQKTGLDYIKDLGVTHVQIMPMYDYATVDETKLDTPQYNWGYDPKNYNVPDGSYSTDPYNGEVRINETKQMIQAFHNEGIGVIMDVVYNHMYSAPDSCLDKTVPDYYFRMSNGKYTNGSGCGNEVASERSMARKYIVDSCVYWVNEYHVDGFRFDLMGCIDRETMAAVRAALDEINPNLIILGEGWTGGTSGLPANEQTNKRVVYKVPGVAAFSDDIRDGLKGSVFENKDSGFISGKANQEIGIAYGVVAAVNHSGINYSAYEKTPGAWAAQPGQCITYSSCHDNLTLWDKIYYSAPGATHEQKLAMNKLSAAVIYTAQGVPFMLSGEEMLRSKPIEGSTEFSHNSYNLNDYTNSMKWDILNSEDVADMHAYYKGLISFRKAHPALRMATADDLENCLKFEEKTPKNVVAYTISGKPNGEKASKLFIAYNGNAEATKITLPKGKWNIYVNGKNAGTTVLGTAEGTLTMDGISAYVLVQEGTSPALFVGIGVAALAVVAGAVAILKRKKK